MEFGEQEGEEGCFREEAQGAGDLGFSDGIRRECRCGRTQICASYSWELGEDGSGSFWVPLASRGASESSSLKVGRSHVWESPQVPEVTKVDPGGELRESHGSVRPRDPPLLPASYSPIYLGAEAGAGALAPRDAGRAHARVSARPGGEGRMAARGSGCRLERSATASSGSSGDSGGSRFCRAATPRPSRPRPAPPWRHATPHRHAPAHPWRRATPLLGATPHPGDPPSPRVPPMSFY